MTRNDFQLRVFTWVRDLVLALRSFPSDALSRVIVSQLLRSGTSVGANYREAQAGSSRRDFVNFVRHALKSARESDYWLQLAQETVPGQNSETTQKIRAELDQLTRMLAAVVIKATRGRA